MKTDFIETLEPRSLLSAALQASSAHGEAASSIHVDASKYPDILYSWHVTGTGAGKFVFKITKQTGAKFSGSFVGTNSKGVAVKYAATGTLSTNGSFKCTFAQPGGVNALKGKFSGRIISGTWSYTGVGGSDKGTFAGHR